MDGHAELLHPAGEDPLDGPLPQAEEVWVPARQGTEIEGHPGEPGRAGDLALGQEAVHDAALIEDLEGSRKEATGACARDVLVGAPLDDRDIDAGQRQLTGQHQARRPGPGDQHGVLGQVGSSMSQIAPEPSTTLGASSPAAPSTRLDSTAMWAFRRPSALDGSVPVVLLGAMMLLVACGTPASAPRASSASGPAVTDPPPASPEDTRAANGATFPPSQTAIQPGTYRWDGFERSIWMSLGAGWELGHDDPAFFDLFRGSDFPSISFARFTDVYVDATRRSEATDAATVVNTLSRRKDVTVTEPIAIELGGLSGRQFDLTTTAPKTALFFGPAGDFRLEPAFKTRYRVLDFPGGGVLVVGVHALAAGFDPGVALADPVTASLQVEAPSP